MQFLRDSESYLPQSRRPERVGAQILSVHMEPRKHKFIIEAFDDGHKDQCAKGRHDPARYNRTLARAFVQIDFNSGCG